MTGVWCVPVPDIDYNNCVPHQHLKFTDPPPLSSNYVLVIGQYPEVDHIIIGNILIALLLPSLLMIY